MEKLSSAAQTRPTTKSFPENTGSISTVRIHKTSNVVAYATAKENQLTTGDHVLLEVEPVPQPSRGT
jgi:hypothetical protein